MITQVPALELIRNREGRYCNADSSVEVIIQRYRYGLSLEINGPGTSRSLGVIGVRGYDLEYCAVGGLPNLVHFTGRLEGAAQAGGDGTIEFASEEAQMSLTLGFAGTSLTLEIAVGSLDRRSFALLKA